MAQNAQSINHWRYRILQSHNIPVSFRSILQRPTQKRAFDHFQPLKVTIPMPTILNTQSANAPPPTAHSQSLPTLPHPSRFVQLYRAPVPLRYITMPETSEDLFLARVLVGKAAKRIKTFRAHVFFFSWYLTRYRGRIAPRTGVEHARSIFWGGGAEECGGGEGGTDSDKWDDELSAQPRYEGESENTLPKIRPSIHKSQLFN